MASIGDSSLMPKDLEYHKIPVAGANWACGLAVRPLDFRCAAGSGCLGIWLGLTETT